MLEQSRKILKRIAYAFRGSKPLEDSKQEKKFNPRERKDGDKMTDVEKMDQGYKGSTYTINGTDGDF